MSLIDEQAAIVHTLKKHWLALINSLKMSLKINFSATVKNYRYKILPLNCGLLYYLYLYCSV